VGTSVGIDWGLTMQFLTMLVPQVLHCITSVALPASALVVETSGTIARVGMPLAYLVLAALFLVLGDRLRQGSCTAWALVVGFAALLLVVGAFQLARVVQNVGHVQRPAISAGVVLLVFDPVALGLLAQPRTGARYRAITPWAAAERRGGRWLAEIAAFALVGGVAVASRWRRGGVAVALGLWAHGGRDSAVSGFCPPPTVPIVVAPRPEPVPRP
jgi:hypothetical protein